MSARESDVLSIHLPNEDDEELCMNTPVVFKGTEVAKLDSKLFATLSPRFLKEVFRTRTMAVQSPIEITSDVTRDTVLLFVAACNGERVEIEKKDALEMFSLAEEWDVRKMIAILEECSDEILIASLLRRIERGEETRNFEEKLHSRFIRIIKNEFLQKEVVKLRMGFLQKMFSKGDHDLVRDHFSEVFPFMKQCVDEHFGSCASVLFTGADVLQWNPDELKWLENSRNFDHSFMGDSYFKIILKQKNDIDDLKRENAWQKMLIDNLISENKRLYMALYQMESGFAKAKPS